MMPGVAMIAHAWRLPERSGARAPILGAPRATPHARYLRRIGCLGLEVAVDAFRASGVPSGPRTGLFSGVGGLRAHWDDMLAAFANQREDGERMWERGLKDVHPYWMLRHLSNNVHALASGDLGLRGEGATFGGGNGGAQALAAAERALHDDAIDAAVVVAYDSLLEPETLVELAVRGDTCIPGEAAAAVVLVRERAGAPRVTAFDRAGRDALSRCREACGGEVSPPDDDIGLGAATALVQAIQLAARGGGTAFAEAPPDLASAVRVEVAR
jgi:hypothetical protein